MSEFNELVRAFLLGNNILFEESEKEPNTFILSEMGKNPGFLPKLFERLKPQKELLRIFILDGLEEAIEVNDEADLIIWNDCFSGKNLGEKIRQKFRPDARYLGMGKDILFARFSGKKRVEDLLEVGKVTVGPGDAEKIFFSEDLLGEKRFVFIIEETGKTQYLKREFNRFMDAFCREQGSRGQSLPVYFEGIDFWFGGMLHAQLTNRLNQDLGLFLTEDTVFYMVRLGYVVPFIDEIDLFYSEKYLNPQAPLISHLFYLCGERGMFTASCSRESLFYEDIRERVDLEKLKVENEKQWLKIIASPMGLRILEDELNAALFGLESGNPADLEVDAIVKENEQKLKDWILNPDFPILGPADRALLLKKVAVKWMDKGSCYLDLREFQAILFDCDILAEGKRTLAYVHEITRTVMNSAILKVSDFGQVIPVSWLMGQAVILWMLAEEYREAKSLQAWLNRQGFIQNLARKLLKRFALDKEKNILTPLSSKIPDIIDQESAPGNPDKTVTRNALEIYIGLKNGGYIRDLPAISSRKLDDLDMSQEIIHGLTFQGAKMQKILFQQSVFIDCAFLNCELNSAYFAGSTFLNCRFEGTDIRNADFSGSFFRGCILKDNKYEDLIFIGCAFEDCVTDFARSTGDEDTGSRMRLDGASGIETREETVKYDLPVLLYLLEKNQRFFSRYGFKISADVEFFHSRFLAQPGMVSNEKFLDQYNYVDVYDEIAMKPELFFSRRGYIHHIRDGVKRDFPLGREQEIYIDHVIKYTETNMGNTPTGLTKILFHTAFETFIEDNPDESQWFKSPLPISDRFVGRGVAAIFINPGKILVATDIGGLFLFEWRDGSWIAINSKFQSEPATKIYPDCFEDLVFVKRGASVIEIWDTLNDLSLASRIVTSFKTVLGLRLIENLNHVLVYGEWGDGSLGALVYNIINKHLVTYWTIPYNQSPVNFPDLEEDYLHRVEESLDSLKDKRLRRVSLVDGFITRGCKELRQFMDSLAIISPGILVYMEGEPVKFVWKIRSQDPGRFPLDKTYTDISTGKKVAFEFELNLAGLANVQSGKLKAEFSRAEISITWKDDSFEIPRDKPWGDYKFTFGVSLLGERQEQENILRIRPKNPFRGGKSLSKKTGSDYLFVGREAELKTALDQVENGASFTIKGARRIGKTSFMNRLRESLPGNVLAAYISLDEFDKGEKQATLLTWAQNGLSRLKEKYPAIYNEFAGDFGTLLDAKPSLGFEWVLSLLLERLREDYSRLLSDILPGLEKDREPGKSLQLIIDKLCRVLKSFDPPFKLVFIIDEIGMAQEKGVRLKDIFSPFRTIIEKSDAVIVLAGVPGNFSELTTKADLITDSGLMSFLNTHIMLGPLTDGECKNLTRNNLSQRIQIEDDTLDYALQLSARRPEDLQIIMQHALDEAGNQVLNTGKPGVIIENRHIETGLKELLKARGDTCYKIWEKITETGKMYLSEKFNGKGQGSHGLTDSAINEKDMGNMSRQDIDILKAYGFTGPDEKLLIIPVYFREWVRLEYYKKKVEKEDETYEDSRL